MRILAIDPGPVESGYVVLDAGKVEVSGIGPTGHMRGIIINEMWHRNAHFAIEMIASYGMAVGREVFETCVWVGRLLETAKQDRSHIVYRKDVKLHLCGSPRAKDANIRQALIDRLGPQGTKKAPGPTYGVKSHAWAALAVAVTVADRLREEMREAA